MHIQWLQPINTLHLDPSLPSACKKRLGERLIYTNRLIYTDPSSLLFVSVFSLELRVGLSSVKPLTSRLVGFELRRSSPLRLATTTFSSDDHHPRGRKRLWLRSTLNLGNLITIDQTTLWARMYSEDLIAINQTSQYHPAWIPLIWLGLTKPG